MPSPYKRRRHSIVRNLWVYRRLVALAMVLGLMLWFIWANNAPVTVAFPFGLGSLSSSLGLVILSSALVGSVATALTMTLVYSLKRRRDHAAPWAEERPTELAEDRPPTDYASKTTEGFSDSRWS
ncbi:lipopolysaccharide assembly protein LapA domain-containing protein [Singulisphaera rosea]